MSDVLYLVRRYLRAHPAKTIILVASLALLLYLPAGMQVLVSRSAASLRERADATPLIVGARGSSLDLALRALYFHGEMPPVMRFAGVKRVRESGFAEAIPLHIVHRVRQQPVVGTTLDYFAFRKLRMAEGQPFGVLGECVLGASAARALDAGVGDKVVTAPETVFDVAGAYPLRMRVVGVLAPSNTPDDEAVFVDVKTAWVIDGLGHGHRDLEETDLLPTKDGGKAANAAVPTFQEITPENQDQFHFHGDMGDAPITAVLALPTDDRARTLLIGRYLAPDDHSRILQPRLVMEDLIATVVRVRGYVLAVTSLLGAATLATVVFLFLLSVRLRRAEMTTMHRIGCSRGMVAKLIGAEAVLVLFVAAALAAGLVGLTALAGDGLIRFVFV